DEQGGAQVPGARGRIEGPTGNHAAHEHGDDGEDSPANVDVPAHQVDLGKGQVLGPHHDGDQEVANHRGHGGNQEEENHVHAVHGEQAVVRISLEEVAVRLVAVQPGPPGPTTPPP